MIGSKTDAEVVREIGRRLRAYRLQGNVSAAEVAAQAGVNRNTVVNAERGANPRIETVVRILRALGRLEALDAFLPPPGLSPLQLMKSAGRTRQRARRRRGG
jgi:transcriptional regulator with XRE-family HTH domain